MTPKQIAAARLTLGIRWGLKRRLKPNELGRLLHLKGTSPGDSVHKWEAAAQTISGPAARVIEALLDGWEPDDRLNCLGASND